MKPALESILGTISTDARVTDVRICIRSTMVMSHHLGLAYTFPLGICPGGYDPHKISLRSGALRESSAPDLAQMALSKNWTEASVGVAAINSLVAPDPKKAVPINGTKILMERCRDKRVTMIGHFNFAEKIRMIARELSVLELRPSEGDMPASEAPNVVPGSDVVIITGTTLVNHTFDEITALAKGSYSMVLGPTTILSPVLFEYGLDAICGVRVVDAKQTIRHLCEGGSFREIRGVEQIAIFKPDYETTRSEKKHQTPKDVPSDLAVLTSS